MLKLGKYWILYRKKILTFNVESDSETKETIIKAMGDLQVKLALERVIALTKAEIEQSVPRVAYRETIRKKAQAQYRHKKQSGGSGQFGEVHLEVEPLPRDGGYEFVNDIFGGAIPKQYIPGVEREFKTLYNRDLWENILWLILKLEFMTENIMMLTLMNYRLE